MSPGVKARGSDGLKARAAVFREALRASFGLLSGVAMVLGVLVGLLLPVLDDALRVNLPVLTFDSQSTARSLLETVATATVSVAGLSFSVTVVAFTLASQQLSPRVLRSFRSDRLSQVTLALFLGTFIYCLTLLVRLGVSGDAAEPPNLSMTLAVLLALAAFTTFAGFIAHVVKMLQPSSIIASVSDDAIGAIPGRYPNGPGEPENTDLAASAFSEVTAKADPRQIAAEDSGVLTVVDVASVLERADTDDAAVRQTVCVGEYVLPGQVIAEYWSIGSGERLDVLEDEVRQAFWLGDQRTLVQDIAFPVRQLADIALKGLSPGINDPTNAEDAMNAMATFLIEFAASEPPCPVRTGSGGEPRFRAVSPGIDYLVKVGFAQVVGAAEDHPVISSRLDLLLASISEAARSNGLSTEECEQQRRANARDEAS